MTRYTLLCACLACGAAPPPATTPAVTTAPSAAERCLAIAGAKRERKSDEPAKVGVKHVLVKWSGAKRAAPQITRTREEACLRAEEARAALEKGASFADVVARYSDEAGAASREGALGAVTRAELAPPFADAAFELHIGDVSYVVESEYGFHVILRTD